MSQLTAYRGHTNANFLGEQYWVNIVTTDELSDDPKTPLCPDFTTVTEEVWLLPDFIFKARRIAKILGDVDAIESVREEIGGDTLTARRDDVDGDLSEPQFFVQRKGKCSEEPLAEADFMRRSLEFDRRFFAYGELREDASREATAILYLIHDLTAGIES